MMSALYSAPLRPAPTTNQPSLPCTMRMPAAISSPNHSGQRTYGESEGEKTPPTISTTVITQATAPPAGNPEAGILRSHRRFR